MVYNVPLQCAKKSHTFIPALSVSTANLSLKYQRIHTHIHKLCQNTETTENGRDIISHVMHEFEKVAADARHRTRKLPNKLHVLFCHLPRRQVLPSKQRWIVQVTLCNSTHIRRYCFMWHIQQLQTKLDATVVRVSCSTKDNKVFKIFSHLHLI